MEIQEIKEQKSVILNQLNELQELKTKLIGIYENALVKKKEGEVVCNNWQRRIKSKISHVKKDITVKQKEVSALNSKIKENNECNRTERQDYFIQKVKEQLLIELGEEKTNSILKIANIQTKKIFNN